MRAHASVADATRGPARAGCPSLRAHFPGQHLKGVTSGHRWDQIIYTRSLPTIRVTNRFDADSPVRQTHKIDMGFQEH